MQTIFIVAHFSNLWAKRLQLLEIFFDVFANLLFMLLGGLTIKWCTMIPQMKKMSNVGIRKFVMHVQNTQIFWKEDQRLVFEISTDPKFI